MICKNCGKEIAEDARWCNFCGAVNFDNPENNNLKEMINNKSTKKIKQQKKQIYQYEYNKKLFYISNIIIYLLFLLITIISSKGINILSAIIMIIITIVYFYTFCIEKILIKDGLDWWKQFIPIYSTYLYYKLCLDETKLFWIILFGPVIILIMYILSVFISPQLSTIAILIEIIFGIFSSIVCIYMHYRLGKKFGKSGLLTVLFPEILIPIIAFEK